MKPLIVLICVVLIAASAFGLKYYSAKTTAAPEIAAASRTVTMQLFRIYDGKIHGLPGVYLNVYCDGDRSVRRVRTNPFGYFRATNVPEGAGCGVLQYRKLSNFYNYPRESLADESVQVRTISIE